MKFGLNLHLLKLQAAYLLGAIVTFPFAPFLFLQGKYTRRKIGKLPDAAGPVRGSFGEGESEFNLLVIGESTVAGVGARSHELAMTGCLARDFSEKTKMKVIWQALGVSGITAKRTTKELVPKIPEEDMNVVVIVLGGNDVFSLRDPFTWRRHWAELLEAVSARQPRAEILIANVPRVKEFPAFPHPLKFVLWSLAKLQHSNMEDFLKETQMVYFNAPGRFLQDDFSDGLHPSELGYARWAEAMVMFFFAKKDRASRKEQSHSVSVKAKTQSSDL